MFRIDSKTLEKISLDWTSKEISEFKTRLEYLLQTQVLTIPITEVEKALKAINKIAQLQLNGKMYGFHLEDTWQQEQNGCGSGIETYLRNGNSLKEYLRLYDSSLSLYPDRILTDFYNGGYREIYTGNIPIEGFFGLQQEYTDESDGHSMNYTPLENYEIEIFEQNGIKVIFFEDLI